MGSLVQSIAALHVVLVVRHLESLSWFMDAVEGIFRANNDLSKVKVDIHITFYDVVDRSGGVDHAGAVESSVDVDRFGGNSDPSSDEIPDLEKTVTKT